LSASSISALLRRSATTARVAVALSVGVLGIAPLSSYAAATTATTTVTSEDGMVRFSYPDNLGLVTSPKLVKTHEKEVFLKSETTKGFNIGYTVDPVKISSITELFKEPKGLADRVVQVELGKEGVFEANVLAARQSTEVPTRPNSIPAYTIEYKIDSSRGQNHYTVKALVAKNKLYVFTAQCKEESLQELQTATSNIVDSFDVQVN